MRTFKTVFHVTTTILFAFLLLTCQKEEGEPIATDCEVAFAINVSNLTEASGLKSTLDYNLSDADKIIITIEYSDGSPTKYNFSEVKIQQMNGDYYTQKIVLKTGNYNLTGFLILNADDSTIFAAPLSESQEAQNVNSPLPINFSVAKNVTTPVNVEVLSTEKKKPEDFGYNRFLIIEVKTFSFMIGVADYESDKLLSANLTVSNGAYSYVQNLDSITNNVVTIKDGLDSYILTVEKTGYVTYTHTYSIDSLKMFIDTLDNPLIIDLVKIPANGLIAYFPFNGNANDESGNGYNGIVFGPVLASDRFSDQNSCYEFDGDDDSIVAPHIPFNNTSFTVCAWIYRYDSPAFDNDDAILGQQGSDGPDYSNNWLHCIVRNNYPYFGYYNNDLRSSSTLIDKDRWYFMTFIFNLEQSQKIIYVDGVMDSQAASGPYQGTTGVTLLGDYNNNAFKGKLDDIRIYNRALNEQEIEELYNE